MKHDQAEVKKYRKQRRKTSALKIHEDRAMRAMKKKMDASMPMKMGKRMGY